MEAGLVNSTFAASSSHQSWRLAQKSNSEMVWLSSSIFQKAEGFTGRTLQRSSRAPAQFASSTFASVNGTKVNGNRIDNPKLCGSIAELPKKGSIINGKDVLSPSRSAAEEEILAIGRIAPLVAAAILAVANRRTEGTVTDRYAGGVENQKTRVDCTSRGKLVENDFIYRQSFVIRSYEVGFDKLATIETFTNLFQEAALNHVGLSDFVGDGMGTTHAMMRHRLIWVVTRMHIQVDRYPVWGDMIEMDSWVCGSGKNGMRRDFLVRDCATGDILSRATSTWAMMNKDTRKLSKMPDDVKAEISPYFYDKYVMKDEPSQKIKKLDDSALFVQANLVPKLRDIDMNQHVNNVKYIGWVLESIPQSLLVAHELVSMTLEYRQECCPSDVVTSMTDPSSPLAIALSKEHIDRNKKLVKQALDKGYCLSSFGLQHPDATTAIMTATEDLKYTHLLRLQAEGSEILRGSTTWRSKHRFLNGKSRIPC